MRLAALSFIVLAALALSGCVATLSGPAFDPYGYQPEYVYLYPDGCWADDAWYAPCPWQPGPNYGYYYFSGGYYYWHPHRNWQYRHGSPPPRSWRYFNPREHRAYPAPPPARPHYGPPHGSPPPHGRPPVPGHGPHGGHGGPPGHHR